MFTASHNPADYNGIKLCRANAVALAADTGLTSIRDRVAAGARARPERRGEVEQRDMLGSYAAHLLDIVHVAGRRLKVVVDAANGMAGHTVPRVFGSLDVELVPLYFELDGSFPNHEANPLNAENLADLQAAVVRERADVGLAFDGDADRCFVVDERGQVIPPSALTGLIAVRELDKEPGARIVYNLISSRAVPEIIARHGGTPVRSRVGHSFVKATMAQENAIFGGEHSGHFYFRDFWYADSGLLAALHLFAALAEENRPASALFAEFDPYVWSGELNLRLDDVATVLKVVEAQYTDEPESSIDHLDGLTVSAPQWWFNIRPSNTEPIVRVNVEGEDSATMTATRDQLLSLLRRSM
jgi:phosphomannomutase